MDEQDFETLLWLRRRWRISLFFSYIPLIGYLVRYILNTNAGICFTLSEKFDPERDKGFLYTRLYLVKFRPEESWNVFSEDYWFEVNCLKGTKQRVKLLNEAVDYYEDKYEFGV